VPVAVGVELGEHLAHLAHHASVVDRRRFRRVCVGSGGCCAHLCFVVRVLISKNCFYDQTLASQPKGRTQIECKNSWQGVMNLIKKNNIIYKKQKIIIMIMTLP
jgi:hypothetical protein